MDVTALGPAVTSRRQGLGAVDMWVGATADGCLLPSLLLSLGLSCDQPLLLAAMPTMTHPEAALSGGFVIVGLSSFAHAYPPGYHANNDGSNQCLLISTQTSLLGGCG